MHNIQLIKLKQFCTKLLFTLAVLFLLPQNTLVGANIANNISQNQENTHEVRENTINLLLKDHPIAFISSIIGSVLVGVGVIIVTWYMYQSNNPGLNNKKVDTNNQDLDSNNNQNSQIIDNNNNQNQIKSNQNNLNIDSNSNNNQTEEQKGSTNANINNNQIIDNNNNQNQIKSNQNNLNINIDSNSNDNQSQEQKGSTNANINTNQIIDNNNKQNQIKSNQNNININIDSNSNDNQSQEQKGSTNPNINNNSKRSSSKVNKINKKKKNVDSNTTTQKTENNNVNRDKALKEADKLINLASNQDLKKGNDGAIKYYEQAKKTVKDAFGSNHLTYAKIIHDIGNALSNNKKDYIKARKYFVEALPIYEKNLGKQDSNYAILVKNIARTYIEEGKYEDALKAVKQHLQTNNNQTYAEILKEIGDQFYKTNQYGKAQHYYTQALPLYKANLGEQDSNYRQLVGYIQSTYLQQGHYEEALKSYDNQSGKKNTQTLESIKATKEEKNNLTTKEEKNNLATKEEKNNLE